MRRPTTLEEKRARQCVYVKKSYYRQQMCARHFATDQSRLNTVHAPKKQVRELEAEYRHLERAVALAQDPANKTPHADHNNATHEQNALEDEQYLEELFAHEDAATMVASEDKKRYRKFSQTSASRPVPRGKHQ